MNIGSVVSSNSHIDYVARVFDRLDVDGAPEPTDYGFGTFLVSDLPGGKAVFLIYNSMLVNPEYANFGPRLSRSEDLERFSPDFLDERGVLLAILALGTLGDNKSHRIPAEVVPAGTVVRVMTDKEFSDFHMFEDRIKIGYVQRIIDSVGEFAVPLIESVTGQISTRVDGGDAESARLRLLKRSLKWQRTAASLRL